MRKAFGILFVAMAGSIPATNGDYIIAYALPD
jgi:glucose dehydrogenase